MPLPVVGPAERQDLALAASGQQEEPDHGDLPWRAIRMRRQPRGQPAHLAVRQEARAPLAAVAPDAQAGVGALGPKTHGFRLPQDDGEHRHGAVGGDRGRAQRCEPVPDVPPVDVGDLPSLEAGQDLVLQVAPIDIERSRLPEPSVALEHGLGDGLEEGLGGIAGRVLSTPDRGESSHGTRPRFVHAHSGCVAEDLPDSVSPMLGMDEEAFAAGGQDPDTEASEFAVANVVGDLAGSKRPIRASVRAVRAMHVLPIAVAAGEAGVAQSVPLQQLSGEKTTLYQIVRTEGASRGVRALRSTRLPAGRAGTFRLPRWAA